MQTGSDQLAQQQRILQAKGFYNGKIDGIWSNKTIEAKKKWEGSGKFSPGIPNNGLPLGDRGPYPKGVYRDPATRLLTCPELEAQKNKPQPVEKPSTTAVEKAPKNDIE